MSLIIEFAFLRPLNTTTKTAASLLSQADLLMLQSVLKDLFKSFANPGSFFFFFIFFVWTQQNWYSYQFTCLQVFEFLKKKDFVAHILKHLATSAISDLLLRLITCVEGTNIKQGLLDVSRLKNSTNYQFFTVSLHEHGRVTDLVNYVRRIH